MLDVSLDERIQRNKQQNRNLRPRGTARGSSWRGGGFRSGGVRNVRRGNSGVIRNTRTRFRESPY